jgi:hypothetical protein
MVSRIHAKPQCRSAIGAWRASRGREIPAGIRVHASGSGPQHGMRVGERLISDQFAAAVAADGRFTGRPCGCAAPGGRRGSAPAPGGRVRAAPHCFSTETPHNVETLHRTETFRPNSMFYFRAAKSFHVIRAQTRAAASARSHGSRQHHGPPAFTAPRRQSHTVTLPQDGLHDNRRAGRGRRYRDGRNPQPPPSLSNAVSVNPGKRVTEANSPHNSPFYSLKLLTSQLRNLGQNRRMRLKVSASLTS